MHTVEFTLRERFINLTELSFNKSLWNSSFTNETVKFIILVLSEGLVVGGLIAIDDDAEPIGVCGEISLDVTDTFTELVV